MGKLDACVWQFAEDDSGAEVAVGHTCVATAIDADLVLPFGDRGNEGRVVYNVQLSPLAFPEGSTSGKTFESLVASGHSQFVIF